MIGASASFCSFWASFLDCSLTSFSSCANYLQVSGQECWIDRQWVLPSRLMTAASGSCMACRSRSGHVAMIALRQHRTGKGQNRCRAWRQSTPYCRCPRNMTTIPQQLQLNLKQKRWSWRPCKVCLAWTMISILPTVHFSSKVFSKFVWLEDIIQPCKGEQPVFGIPGVRGFVAAWQGWCCWSYQSCRWNHEGFCNLLLRSGGRYRRHLPPQGWTRNKP